MALVVRIDANEVVGVLGRLSADLPSLRDARRFDAILDAAFTETQERVHVVTGSLRASGRTASDVQEDVWSGEISYGGPSPGFPNNPVRYARYEQARGAEHDFFASIHMVDDAFVGAVVDCLQGED